MPKNKTKYFSKNGSIYQNVCYHHCLYSLHLITTLLIFVLETNRLDEKKRMHLSFHAIQSVSLPKLYRKTCSVVTETLFFLYKSVFVCIPASLMLHCCFTAASLLLHFCCTLASLLLQSCSVLMYSSSTRFTLASLLLLLLPCVLTSAYLLLHSCFTAASLLLHCCFTAAEVCVCNRCAK